MNDLVRRNPILAALAGAAVLLAVALALEYVFVRPAIDAGAGRKAAPADAKLLPTLVPTVAEQAYPETAARPLFTPTRRPAPEPVAQQQPVFQPGQFVLLGVTMAGDNRIAMLREKSTGRIYRIARGGEVNGIRLAAIERDNVTLAMGGQQEQLPLTVQKAGAPGAPGQPGPGGPGAMHSSVPQGPFGAAAPGAPAAFQPAQGVPAPPTQGGPVPAQGVPVPMPQGAPGQAPAPVPLPAGAPNAGAFPGATASAPAPAADPYAGLSPEEILARRRARRAQTSQ